VFAAEGAPGAPPAGPAAKKPPATIQEIAQRLEKATNRSPEAYSEYLMVVLNPNGAQAHHEPPEPGVQDGLMKPLDYARHQANMDTGMVAHSPDYRYMNASTKVDGDTITLTYTEAMTLPNGQKLAWPMTNRIIVHNGLMDDITVVLNKEALAEIAKMRPPGPPPAAR
jgi:hypothetical protein